VRIESAIFQIPPIIRIGRISMGRCIAGGFYLQHEDGEGQQVSEEDMANLIERFFTENM